MRNKQQLEEQGFTIDAGIFSDEEIDVITSQIRARDTSAPTFRKSEDLFAIRQFLKEFPQLHKSIFTEKLRKITSDLFGGNFFIVKSIYFDKPEKSNWFVPYHQDLTISVDKRTEVNDYNSWTKKHDQFGVQPPLNILESIYTIRIHLDDADENNGALKVIPGSHLKGIYRPDTIDWTKEEEVVCSVPKGGIMIMRPLLLHSSGRTTNNNQRRVIHIELSNADLHADLNWSERTNMEY